MILITLAILVLVAGLLTAAYISYMFNFEVESGLRANAGEGSGA